MIVEVKPEYASTVLRPLVEGLVEQEGERGEVLVLEKFIKGIEDGVLTTLIFMGPNGLEPLMTLFLRGSQHPFTGQNVLWVDNIFVPDASRLYAEFDREDAKIFLDMVKQFDKCLFLSDNPAVVAMVEQLGLKATAVQTVYSIGEA